MSGGVDSSVAALILRRQGLQVVGVTMQLFPQPQTSTFDSGLSTGRSCCSLTDVLDAKEVSNKLDFDHQVHNFSRLFQAEVIERFVKAYLSGRTPNPCIDCNRRLKFTRLYERAQLMGLDLMATGHYVRTATDPKTGRRLLLKAKDPEKDQSYVLYGLTQEELARTVFPLGNILKSEVRSLASQAGLINASKPDSQDICFVRDGAYAGFVENLCPFPVPGDIIDLKGQTLGRHQGIHHYTVGQRKGLGICGQEPLYVVKIDAQTNSVTVGPERALYSDGAIVSEVNLISINELTAPLEVQAKIRYRQPPFPAVLEPIGPEMVRLRFKAPQKAVTPGQAAVFYLGDVVVGGGTIEAPLS
ncbi:MAG: tRNA 2-thiouridine(34) synthase MnmA [Deltaproteobacteria bacterium]|jgi:tRNA-specific 2-thiouridylase|nr:tRNA 2-thiouridine(34) synthase MnmA [Deltaproteobacteria bacterium]